MNVSFAIAEQSPLQDKTNYHSNDFFRSIYRTFS